MCNFSPTQKLCEADFVKVHARHKINRQKTQISLLFVLSRLTAGLQ